MQRLAPLGVPAASDEMTATEALAFPAVQLFVERAATSLDAFELSDADAPVVANICRGLDGIPLAIELAAGRVDHFGIHGVAARLDDRLRLLAGGRRTALPRHRTLGAALDWSYEALPETERAVLRRIGIFAGSFSMEAAGEIVPGTGDAATDLAEIIADLFAKSLVTVNIQGATAQYRLLDTMRAYAIQKLVESGEFKDLARRHAEYFREVFQRTKTQWKTLLRMDWTAAYGANHLDDVSAALDWAFSPGGDTAIGVALTLAAVPLWMKFSLFEGARRRFEQALASLAFASDQEAQPRMQLYAALGSTLLFGKGPGPEINAAWSNALDLAEHLDDNAYRLHAFFGFWITNLISCRFRVALNFTDEFRSITAIGADPNNTAICNRLTGITHFFLGNLSEARRYLDAVRIQEDRPTTAIDSGRVTARAYLSHVLWLQGHADQAMRTAESVVDNAEATNDHISRSSALCDSACLIALATGDLVAAERFVARFLEYSAKHSIGPYRAWARCYHGAFLLKRGDVDRGLPLLRAALDEIELTGWRIRHSAFLGILAEGLGDAGAIVRGFEAVNEALARSERDEEHWCTAELLHVKSKLLRQANRPDAAARAEEHLHLSLDCARRQGALAWELRAATSLARLWREQHRVEEARNLLTSVYSRFVEGFGTADLVAAKTLLNELQ